MNIKGLLIDSETQTIKRISVNNLMTIGETTKILNTKYIDVVNYRNSVLYFNEYGVDDNLSFFRFKDLDVKWYGGKAILLDVEEHEISNNLNDCSLDLGFLKKNIMWCQVDNEESKKVLKPKPIKIYMMTMDDVLDMFDDDMSNEDMLDFDFGE